jgi:hypothetical protein
MRHHLTPVFFPLYQRIAPPYPPTVITVPARNPEGSFSMDFLNDSPVNMIFKI